MSKSHGPRHRSRNLLKKKVGQRGLPAPGKFLQKFKVGEKVAIRPEAAVQKGMPAVRYIGSYGTVIAEKGRCYVVEIMDGNKRKQLISAPVHLKRVGG